MYIECVDFKNTTVHYYLYNVCIVILTLLLWLCIQVAETCLVDYLFIENTSKVFAAFRQSDG